MWDSLGGAAGPSRYRGRGPARGAGAVSAIHHADCQREARPTLPSFGPDLQWVPAPWPGFGAWGNLPCPAEERAGGVRATTRGLALRGGSLQGCADAGLGWSRFSEPALRRLTLRHPPGSGPPCHSFRDSSFCMLSADFGVGTQTRKDALDCITSAGSSGEPDWQRKGDAWERCGFAVQPRLPPNPPSSACWVLG